MTIDFQDRGKASATLDGLYQGFSWSGGWTTDNFGGGSNIFARGVDGTVMDFSGPDGFLLTGFEFKVRYAENQATKLTVSGYDGSNALVWSKTLDLTESWQTCLVSFGSVPLDRLVFTATTGGKNSRFFIDDIAVAPVPEPGTMLLLGTGLVGLAGYGRKRRLGS